MPRALLPANPSVARAAEVWTQQYAATLREAAGDSGIMTPQKAQDLDGPYADNIRAWFAATGRQRAHVDQMVDSARRYVTPRLERAAQGDGHLSLVDIRRLPEDLIGDFLALRGRPPAQGQDVQAIQAAVDAANHRELNDYGKSFDLLTFPKGTTREEVLNRILLDPLTREELAELFTSTRRRQAATAFAGDLRQIGSDERRYREEEPEAHQLSGRDAERLIHGVVDAVLAQVLPMNKVKSLEYAVHTIAEDGDVERRILLAKRRDDTWIAVSYTDFPF